MESLRRVRTVFTVLCFIGAVFFFAVAYTSALSHTRLAFFVIAAATLMAAYAARSHTIGEAVTIAWFFVFAPIFVAKIISENSEHIGEGLMFVGAITIGLYVAVRVTWWIIAPLVARLRYKLRA